MQDCIEHAELVDPAVHIQTMPNLISELSSEHLKALQITDIDAISLSQMLRQEKERCEVLELELTRITQNYMKALKAQEESKYWQDKCISLKIEVAMLTHDLKVLQDERKQKDSVELASLNIKIESEHAELIKQQKDEMHSKIISLEDSLMRKDEVINDLRQQLDTLNNDLNNQKTEESILKNILELPDQHSTMRFLFTVQTRVNQKIYENMVKQKSMETSNSEGNKLSNGNGKLQSSNLPYFGFNPLLLQNANGYNVPISPFPIYQAQPLTDNINKLEPRED